MGEWEWRVTANEYEGFFFLSNEKFLKLDCDDGCTIP
jgi:hypothetical protein